MYECMHVSVCVCSCVCVSKREGVHGSLPLIQLLIKLYLNGVYDLVFIIIKYIVTSRIYALYASEPIVGHRVSAQYKCDVITYFILESLAVPIHQRITVSSFNMLL